MLSIFHFYMFLTPLALCSVLVPYVSNLSAKIGGIDTPDARKVHTQAVPRLGGIAIFLSLLFTAIFFGDINQQLKGFLAGAIVVFLTGLADDLASLTPRQKFAGEIVAAGLAVLLGDICVRHIGNPFGMGIIELGPMAIPFTIIGIVGLINAINLMDGLDGLAGGVCAIACISFSAISYTSGNSILVTLSLALLGALIGFLRYNTYPASIFMGDGGSLLLGYCMGVFSVLLAFGGTVQVSPYIPLMILGVPILDTLVVMTKRKQCGKRLFMPDKSHLHHRLLDLGIGHKYTVLIVISISYMLSMIAIYGSALSSTTTSNLSDTVLLILLILIAVSLYSSLYFLTTRGVSGFDFTGNQFMPVIVNHRLLVRMTGYLTIGIKVLLIAILLLPVFLPHDVLKDLSILPFAVLALAIFLFVSRRAWGDLLLQIFLYCVSFLLIITMENYGRNVVVLGVPLLQVSHVLFLLLMAFEGVKVFIRKRAAHLVVSRFEYLILLLVMSAPLFPKELTGQYHLMTVTAKSIILFIGFKLVLMRQVKRNRKIMLAIMFSIMVIVGRYLFGI